MCDVQYYQQRAIVERSRAKSAPTPEIAAVHEELARLYDNLTGVAVSAEAPSLSSPRSLPQAQSQAQSDNRSE
jgi:hypothetical protein